MTKKHIEEYEEIMQEALEKMDLVKAPMKDFYDALQTFEGRIADRIQVGRDLGETDL